jgi:DNA-3-methyladenine glycosylase
MSGSVILPRDFYDRDPLVVAPQLLNKVLVVRGGPDELVRVSGRIVEVEAYRGLDDEAAHTHRGPTPRTATMFGPPGHLYVYFSYGMHWCANAVTSSAGVGDAVLVRALEPIEGVDMMFERRSAAGRTRDLCSGPAKLCQALSISGALDGVDLTEEASPVVIVDDGVGVVSEPQQTTRIGLSKSVELPWRWMVPGNRHVSR